MATTAHKQLGVSHFRAALSPAHRNSSQRLSKLEPALSGLGTEDRERTLGCQRTSAIFFIFAKPFYVAAPSEGLCCFNGTRHSTSKQHPFARISQRSFIRCALLFQTRRFRIVIEFQQPLKSCVGPYGIKPPFGDEQGRAGSAFSWPRLSAGICYQIANGFFLSAQARLTARRDSANLRIATSKRFALTARYQTRLDILESGISSQIIESGIGEIGRI